MDNQSKTDWLIKDRKCGKSFPDCYVCPVDTKIQCKHHETTHYDRVIYDRIIHITHSQGRR